MSMIKLYKVILHLHRSFAKYKKKNEEIFLKIKNSYKCCHRFVLECRHPKATLQE